MSPMHRIDGGRTNRAIILAEAAAVLALATILTAGWLPGAAQDPSAGDILAQARTALERHNYPTAIERADAFLRVAGDVPEAVEAKTIRALAQLGLKQWDDGAKALAALLDDHPELQARADLREALASVALQNFQFGYLAFEHYPAAVDIHQAAGDRGQAARDLIALGKVCIRVPPQFWKQDGGEPPDDWQAARQRQRIKAAEQFDAAVALQPAQDIVIEALQAKATMYARELTHDDSDIDKAIDIYRAIIGLDPPGATAAESYYAIGDLHESRRQDYAAAVAAFESAVVEAERSPQVRKRAESRVDRIKAPMLSLEANPTSRSKAAAEIHLRTRNIKELRFAAYRIDAESFISLSRNPRHLAQWQPAQPAATEWTVSVPDDGTYEFYRPGGDGYNPATFEPGTAGAYIVVAQGRGISGGDVRDVTAIIFSDIVAIVKAGRQAGVCWLVNADDGSPVVDAKVQAYLGTQSTPNRTGKTDDAGVFLLAFDESLKTQNDPRLAVWFRHGDHLAHCSSYLNQYRGQRDMRVYSMTDRPVYRPGQTVHFKHVLRYAERGDFEVATNKKATTRIRSPQGEVVYEESRATNANGSVSGDWTVPQEAVLGRYFMEVECDGNTIAWGNDGAQFLIEEYRKPEFKVTVEPTTNLARIGDKVDASIVATYYYGDPVVGADVTYHVFRTVREPQYMPPWPCPWLFKDADPSGAFRDIWLGCWPMHWEGGWGRDLVMSGATTTDDQGKALITIATEAYDDEWDREQDQRYIIEAEVTDNARRTINGSGAVAVSRRPFDIFAIPRRYTIQPGDNAHIDLIARDANGKPVAFEGTAEVFRLNREITGEPNDRTETYTLGDRILDQRVSVTKEAGGVLRFIADEAGPFRIVVRADAPNEPDELKPVGEVDIWVTQPGGRYDHFAYREIEIIPDKPYYEIGDTARVLVQTLRKEALVLLSQEADDILSHRIVVIRDGSAVVELPITNRHAPNFSLSAMLIDRNVVFVDERDITVPPTQQMLAVSVDMPLDEYRPATSTEATVSVVDHEEQPVESEVAVMVVDSSVYYIHPEFRRAIDEFFYGERRGNEVSTTTNLDDIIGMRGRGTLFKGGGFDEAAAAPMASRQMAMSMESDDMAAKDGSEEGFSTPVVRSQFADAIVWQAHARTDASGTVVINVPFPDNLTTWTLHAVAIDRKTRVGEASKDVVTSKPIIARLQAPRFLVEGDEAELLVIAHNDTDEELKARVSLTAGEGITLGSLMAGEPAMRSGAGSVGRSGDGHIDITVPAKGETRVSVRATATRAGFCKLNATVAGKDDGDAVEITLPILTYGGERLMADGTVLRPSDETASHRWTFELPERMVAASPRLTVNLSPSVATVMIDALPYLFDYPYGCTEQTMSRFLPAVMARHTLQKMGVDLAEVKRILDARPPREVEPPLPGRWYGSPRVGNPVFEDAAVDSMVTEGVRRLASMQHGDGGWGWWKNDESSPYMTAYVVYGLAEGRRADVTVDAGMIDRGVAFLKERVKSREAVSRWGGGREDANVRMWMLYALAADSPKHVADADVRAVLDRLYDGRDDLTDYGRAMLAIVLHQAGDKARRDVVLENFENTLVENREANTVHWGAADGYRYWYDNGLETTAMVVRALMTVDATKPWVTQAVNWIVKNRQGPRWRSTKDTAFAVYALSDFLTRTNELDPDMTVDVVLDGKPVQSWEVNAKNVLGVDMSLSLDHERLATGKHTVEITRHGRGTVYSNMFAEYFSLEDPIPPGGHDVAVERKYFRVTPHEVDKVRSVWDPQTGKMRDEKYRDIEYELTPIADGEPLAPGDIIEAVSTIRADADLEYMMIADPKPAGCEPLDLTSGGSYGDGLFAHMELRDEQVTFFAPWFAEGERTVRYRLRCETPGRFHALPASAEAMYAPFVKGSSRSDVLRITE